MVMNKLSGEKVISGSFGELWLDNEFVGEAIAMEAKIEIEKEDVPLVGNLGTDSKFIGYKGSGTLRMHKANSRMITKISDMIRMGYNPRFKILSDLKDPASDGAERIIILDANFNDLTLVNWELKKKGEIEAPFTFTKWEHPDLIHHNQ